MIPDFKKGELIASYPAWDIYRAKPRIYLGFREGISRPIFSANDILGLPFETQRYGTMYHWFTFGSVASYALHCDKCPIEAWCKARARGHKLYWLNPNGSILTAEKRAKEDRVALDFEDEIIFEGHLFRIVKEANQNAGLVEVSL
jgi:hypothetical protein